MTVDDLQMLADNGTISEDDAAKLIKQMKDAKTYIDNIKLGKDNRYWVRMPDNSMIRKNDYNKMVAAINKYFRDEDKSKKNLKFDDVYKMWLAEKSLKAQDSTRTRNVTDYNRYYADSDFVKKLISSITTDDIDLFIHTHIRTGNLDYKQYSNMSLIVRQVLKFAKKKGFITVNPMDNFELAKNVLRKSKKAESVDEVFLPLETKNILNAISDRKNKDYIVPLMIALVFYCGIRNGELTTLKWSDIKDGYLHIQRTETKYYILDADGNKKEPVYDIKNWTKSDAGMREIYIIPKMQKIFDEVKKINISKGYYDDDYIFVDQNGRIKTTQTASYLYRLCDKLNIPRRGMHSIRKTVISKMIDEAVHNKKSLEEVRRISGDNTIDMLLKHYYYSLQDKSETEDFMVEALSW